MIENLLEKYFNGETTCDEERELRRFFTQPDVPEHLQAYRPLFAYIGRKAEEARQTVSPVQAVRRPSRFTVYLTRGIAACLLLGAGIAGWISYTTPPECYVIIDGKRYTDRQLIREKTMEALQSASFTDEDLGNLISVEL